MEICSTNATQARVFDFPFHGALIFNKLKSGYLTVVNGEKKMEVEVAFALRINDKFPLQPLIVNKHLVHLNVLSNEGELFRISLKIRNYTQINHFLVLDCLPKLNSKKEENPLLLSTTGLTENEYKALMAYYIKRKPDFEKLIKPLFIKRNVPEIPRSIVILPKGPHKGAYALLKTHGGAKEVGLGTYARITLALPLHADLPLYPSDLKVCRSSKKTKTIRHEAKINKTLLENIDLFAVGTKFKYTGPIRCRSSGGSQRVANEFKDHLPQVQNVKKIGFIMEYLQEGDLLDFIYIKKSFNFSSKKTIAFVLKYAYALSVLHNKYKIVHYDQKPENIFLNKEWQPKIGDFGFSIKSGEIKGPCGSECYLPPEALQMFLDDNHSHIKAPVDIWTFGLILLTIIGGLELWQELCRQDDDDDWYFILYDNNLEEIKSEIFNKLKGTSEVADLLIPIINRCLKKNPNDRLKIDDVVNILVLYYYSLANKKKSADKDNNLSKESYSKST